MENGTTEDRAILKQVVEQEARKVPSHDASRHWRLPMTSTATSRYCISAGGAKAVCSA